MNRTEYIQLLAQYNQLMNARLIAAANKLTSDAVTHDRKAFFGSILGTLNHLAVGDTLWLKRFVTHPAQYASLSWIKEVPTPTSLTQVLYADLISFSVYREAVDQMVVDWAAEVSESHLDHVLQYTNSRGEVGNRPFFGLIMHFFNHQTHHRGQTTTMLSQAGVDVGVTDLITLIGNEPTSIADN